jgi:hypothetical protein
MKISNSGFSSGLDLRNSDNSLMAFVCPSLPEVIRRGLTSSLLACFDGKEALQMQRKQDFLDDQDSDDEPEVERNANHDLEKRAEQILSRPFQCLHFSIWNRYSTTVGPSPIPLKIQYEDDISYRELMRPRIFTRMRWLELMSSAPIILSVYPMLRKTF